MALLTKAQIFAQDDLTSVILDIPSWGGEVRVGTMSGFARDRFEAGILGKNGGLNTQNIRAKLAAATIIDEDGKLVFDEADIIKLGNKSCAALDLVFEAALKLNKLSNKDVEGLAKNL